MPDPTPLWIPNPGTQRLAGSVREHLFDPARPTRHLPRLILAAVGGVVLMTGALLATAGAPASVALLPLGMALDGVLTFAFPAATFAAAYFGLRGIRSLARRLRGGPPEGRHVGVDAPGLEGLNWFGDPQVGLGQMRQIPTAAWESPAQRPPAPTLDRVPTHQARNPWDLGH